MKFEVLGGLYKTFAKPLFFMMDPEDVHDRMTSFGHFLGQHSITRTVTGVLFDHEDPILEQKVTGIKFKSPVGLSAGFDKDANLMQILPYVSFGFMQIGSITNKPYAGNPKPRLIRLPNSKSLVVYYGLKNIGVTKIIPRLKKAKYPKDFKVSISIAKTNSKISNTTAKGVKDYAACLEKVIKSDVGDFYTINISCPNTFGGEPFTTPDKLDKLLGKLTSIPREKPMYVKMPINLPWGDFDKLMKVNIKHGIDGVIIGNLNKDHEDPFVKDEMSADIKGGLSGLPTKHLCNNLIAKTYKKYGKKIAIVGVGGIFSAEDAYEKIRLGASLVQLITGMIYEGPQLIGTINRDLAKMLRRDGYKNISEAIGVSSR